MTPQVLKDSEASAVPAGSADVQTMFDNAMKRLAEMYEDWQRSSRAALQEIPPQPAAADSVEPLSAEVPQAA